MKKNILLIEDEKDLVIIYKNQFRNTNLKLFSANRWQEASILLKKIKFDLILLDVVLPSIDGFEILQKIKKNPKFKNTKICMLSNLGGEDEHKKALNLGALDYIIKSSLTPTQLVSKITLMI
ncbi:response regulator [Patescibacteria group bacterium]|nr:response regulator [Patescibacteria group bacterium]